MFSVVMCLMVGLEYMLCVIVMYMFLVFILWVMFMVLISDLVVLILLFMINMVLLFMLLISVWGCILVLLRCFLLIMVRFEFRCWVICEVCLMLFVLGVRIMLLWVLGMYFLKCWLSIMFVERWLIGILKKLCICGLCSVMVSMWLVLVFCNRLVISCLVMEMCGLFFLLLWV